MNRLVWSLLFAAVLIDPLNAQKGPNPQDQSTARIDASKVIYHPRLKPKALTTEQISELSTLLNLNEMPKESVWFGRVLFNDVNELALDIYFEPTQRSARVFRGTYLHYDSVVFNYRNKSQSDRPTVQPDDLLAYAYVRDPNSTELELPIPSNLPFSCLGDFSEKEIIELVTFIKSGPSVKQNKRMNSSFSQRADAELPIMSMQKEGNAILVRTGTLERSEAGSGQSLEIIKTRKGYELLSIGYWVS